MTYKPDYGLMLLNNGVSRDTQLTFPSFALYSLTIISECEYTTMVEIPIDGEMYALSLDFDQHKLDQILNQTQADSKNILINELEDDPYTPRTIDIKEPIIFGAIAYIGPVQSNQYEQFAPLILSEIINDNKKDYNRDEVISKLSDILGKHSEHIVMSEHFKRQEQKDIAKNELVEFCLNDYELDNVIKTYNLNADNIEQFFKMLSLNGAGQWVNNYYVAVASLAKKDTLEFIASNTNKITWPDISYKLIEYFKNIEVSTDLDNRNNIIEIIQEISEVLPMHEESIKTHPDNTVNLYNDLKVILRSGQTKNWNRYITDKNLSLSAEEVDLINNYIVASSFISAWYHLHHDTKQRNKATNSCVTLISSLGLPSDKLLLKYINTEKLWQKSMKEIGLGSNRNIFILLALISIMVVIYFINK